MILSVRVVRITSHFPAMRRFYEQQLDMRPVANWDRGPADKGVILVHTGRTSTTSVEILTAGDGSEAGAGGEPGAGGGETGVRGSSARAPAGIALAFEVDNVGAAYETLAGRGVAITSEPEYKPWGHRSFSVTDPDGLEITLFQDMNAEDAG